MNYAVLMAQRERDAKMLADEMRNRRRTLTRHKPVS